MRRILDQAAAAPADRLVMRTRSLTHSTPRAVTDRLLADIDDLLAGEPSLPVPTWSQARRIRQTSDRPRRFFTGGRVFGRL